MPVYEYELSQLLPRKYPYISDSHSYFKNLMFHLLPPNLHGPMNAADPESAQGSAMRSQLPLQTFCQGIIP